MCVFSRESPPCCGGEVWCTRDPQSRIWRYALGRVTLGGKVEGKVPDKVQLKKERKTSTAEQPEDGDQACRWITTMAVKMEEGCSRGGPSTVMEYMP